MLPMLKNMLNALPDIAGWAIDFGKQLFQELRSAFEAVDFNVLLMIAGTMGTVALVIESRMPFLLSDLIVEKVPNVKWAIVIKNNLR